MKYLVKFRGRGKGKSRAHLWEWERDTVCRLWSTGGITKQSNYTVCDSPGEHEICHMCRVVSEKREAA